MSYQSLPTQTAQAGPVVYTYLPQSTNVNQAQGYSSASDQGQQQQNLSTGWIIAIVAIVLLAISLTYMFWNWRRRRNAGRYGPPNSGYVESQEYTMQRPRAARVRDSVMGYRSGRER